MKPLWIAASIFLVLACSWFVMMEFILRHPGFELRAAVAALVVLHAALCIVYNRSRVTALRRPLIFSAIAIFSLGIYALIFEFRTPDFEGYIFLIALGLIAQGTLTLIDTLVRPRLHPA
jgi:hypothetical protein